MDKNHTIGRILRTLRTILVAVMLGLNKALNGNDKDDDNRKPNQELPE